MQGPVSQKRRTAACARKARLADDSSVPAPSATFSNTPNTWRLACHHVHERCGSPPSCDAGGQPASLPTSAIASNRRTRPRRPPPSMARSTRRSVSNAGHSAEDAASKGAGSAPDATARHFAASASCQQVLVDRRARLPNAAGAPSRRTPAPACPRTSRRTPGRMPHEGLFAFNTASLQPPLPHELERLGRPGHERVRAVGPVGVHHARTPARQARSRTADGEPAALPTLRGTREPACGARPTPPRPRTASPSRRSGTVRLAGRRSRQCSWGRLLSRRPPF